MKAQNIEAEVDFTDHSEKISLTFNKIRLHHISWQKSPQILSFSHVTNIWIFLEAALVLVALKVLSEQFNLNKTLGQLVYILQMSKATLCGDLKTAAHGKLVVFIC